MMDGTVIGSIDTSGQRDTYTFNLPIDSRLYFDSLTNNGNLAWSLSGRGGTVVNGRSFNDSDAVDISNPTLNLIAGDYTLTVDASAEATGTYSFRLPDLASAEPITPGAAVSGQLAPAAETDVSTRWRATGSFLTRKLDRVPATPGGG
jgi:hypothetical protein